MASLTSQLAEAKKEIAAYRTREEMRLINQLSEMKQITDTQEQFIAAARKVLEVGHQNQIRSTLFSFNALSNHLLLL